MPTWRAAVGGTQLKRRLTNYQEYWFIPTWQYGDRIIVCYTQTSH